MEDELLPEYRFDKSKAKPNRFALRDGRIVVVLEPEIAKAFPNSKAVNDALRNLLGDKGADGSEQAAA